MSKFHIFYVYYYMKIDKVRVTITDLGKVGFCDSGTGPNKKYNMIHW